ncbi:MAG: carboxypeptidase-like regulatory domain-containing protein [Planctomycetaceae bacterium]|nr:carboxypeptidase-like regulatory domain-containing protein [Planctomycetaceae bacterium]
MTSRTYSFVFLCSFLAVGLLPGCHKNKGNPDYRVVKGKVTWDGSLVEGATVNFFPLDNVGVPAVGFTDAEGNYALTATDSLEGGTGTKPGKYRVTVKKLSEAVDQNTADLESGKITQEEFVKRQYANPQPVAKPKDLLPAGYADPAKSPLEVTVEDVKTNMIDLELKSQ